MNPKSQCLQWNRFLPWTTLLVMSLGTAAGSSDVGWGYYNGTLNGERFSTLNDITASNLNDLKESCEASLGDAGSFEAGPLVIGNTLFVTTEHTTVALNATDCSVSWRNRYTPTDEEIYPINRGVAYLDGRVFRGTSDGRLLALDAATGKELWRMYPPVPNTAAYFSAAPIAWNGLLIIGPAPSDMGIRGYVAAFDAATGKQVWRFATVPIGSELGAETWTHREAAQHGGGGTWSSYTLDQATGELFVSVGNPAPTFLPGDRPGANLFTSSMVVLDAKTGALKWYYQVTPNDRFDYDLGAAPVLYADRNGKRRIALGSKDGHVYILDRDTHKLTSRTPVTTIQNRAKSPTPQGVEACPGAVGGVEWNGPAYSPATGRLYVGSVDWCYIFKSAAGPYQAGQAYLGGSLMPAPGASKTGWLYALDGKTGKPVWNYHSTSPIVAAVTPTAGGLVFTGNAQGEFLVFDAQSGNLLRKEDVQGSMGGGVITYAVNGKQFVALTAGNISRAGFTSAKASPRVIIMTTGLKPGQQPIMVTADEPTEVPEGSEKGSMLFAQYCSVCHGPRGVGGSGAPSLAGEAERKNLQELMAWLENPDPPMPRLTPQPLSAADMAAVAVYVEGLKSQ